MDRMTSSTKVPKDKTSKNHESQIPNMTDTRKLPRHNGVADYFAILGIGETLQRKATAHPQPANESFPHENTAGTPLSTCCDGEETAAARHQQQQQQQQQQEEQCQMMQRFYREIVHVGILTVYTGETVMAAPGNPKRGFYHISSHNNRDISYSTHRHRHKGNGTVIPVTQRDDESQHNYTFYAAGLATSCKDGGEDILKGQENHSIGGDCDDEDNSSRDSGAGCSGRTDNRLNGGMGHSDRVVSYYDVEQDPLLLPLRLWSGNANTTTTTATTAATNTNTTNTTAPIIQTPQEGPALYHLPKQVDGFEIIYNTIRASASSFCPEGDLQQRPDTQQQQQQHQSSVTLNMSSLSMNSTFDGGSSMKDHHDYNNILPSSFGLWTQDQTFCANLHPEEGYRGTLLSHRHMSVSMNLEDSFVGALDANQSMKSCESLSFRDSLEGGGGGGGSEQDSRHFLSKLTRPTMNKLRQHMPSMLYSRSRNTSKVQEGSCNHHPIHSHSMGRNSNHNHDCNNPIRCDDENVESPRDGDGQSALGSLPVSVAPSSRIVKKEFYVGYRRRGPDEVDTPGIADCKIIYCRIHKESILPEKNDLRKRLSIHGDYETNERTKTHVSKTNHIHDDADDMRKIKGILPKTFNGITSKKTADVMKRGILTGAEIAKSVVSQGREKLKKVVVSGNGSFAHDDMMPTIQGNNPSENIGRGEGIDLDVQGCANNYSGYQITDANFMHDTGFTNCDVLPPSATTFHIYNLENLVGIPEGYDELVIPEMYQKIRLPIPPPSSRNSSPCNRKFKVPSKIESPRHSRKSIKPHRQTQGESTREMIVQNKNLLNHTESSSHVDSDIGIEACVSGHRHIRKLPNSPSKVGWETKRNPWSPIHGTQNIFDSGSTPDLAPEFNMPSNMQQDETAFDRDAMMPLLVQENSLSDYYEVSENSCSHYEFIPLLALRRQRVRNEERFHEDPCIVDLAMTFIGFGNRPIVPEDVEDDIQQNEKEDNPILGMSPWITSSVASDIISVGYEDSDDDLSNDGTFYAFGTPHIITKKNLPLGFLDIPFATRVLDRFPKKDYKGLPLPEEELPMFCYPTGCKLIRCKYQDAPLPEHYGFVVKNERGDSIYVSCASFVEPLKPSKQNQLDELSKSRIMTSLPHRFYWEQHEKNDVNLREDKSSFMAGFEEMVNGESSFQHDQFLTGFDDMITFEHKTICLISRYPFWSAFRRFLSHLHIMSGSSSDLPLERYISHLLLTVPVPKPGGQCILIPLPAVASPMVIGLPPFKDFPVLDLSFRRLFSCLDVPTVVTIVLAFLALEKKVIIMSAYPSLVSDACELLRSLLFPFELCAPYVPRLTEPFMSCLHFPGAIFVGIHDDRTKTGLASSVRKSIPEDTFIVDLDTGDIDCNGERFEILKDCWEIIPTHRRSSLVEEIETLCRDANVNPGQEPTGAEVEAALDTADVSFAPLFEDESISQLDDRAIRDAFLRFFCHILGGYERFLLVPDVDFVVSGNEWFDAKGFLAFTEKQSRSPFLHSFVSTQLFQSFIQRRTEASDMHCLLFDECLAEYHSSKESYGRLAEVSGVANDEEHIPRYELLVDQCASELYNFHEIDESSSAETSILTSHTVDGFMINNTGDLVTAPSKRNLPPGNRYVYCIDGHPCFPEEMDTEMFYPKEPEFLSAEFDDTPVPTLTRSDRELDVSNRRRKLAASRRGVHRQRRCLFQLPKLMGSHVLNSWLMCIPYQVSQQFQNSDQQSIYLLRALGVLRLMRSRHRIVPDEAGYRCLIIACGRAQSDRRQDVVKLFGLLRSDGIFPSAVTLGQYTRSIAEGYSKQVPGKPNSVVGDSIRKSCIYWNDSLDERLRNFHLPNALEFLDGNILNLDEIGSRWRQGREAIKRSMEQQMDHDSSDQPPCQRPAQGGDKRIRSFLTYEQDWMPVSISSSFSPHWKTPNFDDDKFDLVKDFRFIALWSRATKCTSCEHELLDEEIQSGWDDDVDDFDETPNNMHCPCCGAIVEPKLGYIEMAPFVPDISKNRSTSSKDGSGGLPPQIQNYNNNNIHSNHNTMKVDGNDERLGHVPYLSPSKMRANLESVVESFGENILEREKLRYLNPTLFFNLWWFCCRFSLPLPLAISNLSSDTNPDAGAPIYNNHCCAFAAWDQSIAIAACHSASKAIFTLQNTIKKNNRPTAGPEFKSLIETFQSHKMKQTDQQDNKMKNAQSILQHDNPLLASLNFQSMGQSDWENHDLSKILVKLVEACDKRDFHPAMEAILQCNKDRCAKFGDNPNFHLDGYRTLLYLTRYQCTSAFHKFFPTTSKTCKGYHFWCPNSTVSIFDRLFRDALERLRAEGNVTPIHDVSDVALGFRSVFGHII